MKDLLLSAAISSKVIEIKPLEDGEAFDIHEKSFSDNFKAIKTAVDNGADINHRAKFNGESYGNSVFGETNSKASFSFTPLQLELIFKDYPWVEKQLRKSSLSIDQQVAEGTYYSSSSTKHYYVYNLLDAAYLFPECDGNNDSKSKMLDIIRKLIKKRAKISRQSLSAAFDKADIEFFKVINEESKYKAIDQELLKKLLPTLFFKPVENSRYSSLRYVLRNDRSENLNRNYKPEKSTQKNTSDLERRLAIIKLLAQYSNTSVKNLLNNPLPPEIISSLDDSEYTNETISTAYLIRSRVEKLNRGSHNQSVKAALLKLVN